MTFILSYSLKQKYHKKIVGFILLSMIFISIYSCKNESKNEVILKKIASDFIKENGVNIIQRMMYDSINNMTIVIEKQEYLVPSSIPPPQTGEKGIKLTYLTLDLYVFYYSNHYFDNEFLPPPSKLFYIDGYPIMLYTKNIPPMDKKEIPQYLYRNEIVWTGSDEWLVAICKKTHKYIVIKDSYMKGDKTIEEVNAFNESCLRK